MITKCGGLNLIFESLNMSETRTPSTSGKEQLIKVCVRMKPVSKEQEECEHFW